MLHVKFKTRDKPFAPTVGNWDCADCARTLREIARKLDRGVREGNVLNSNGDVIGTYRLTKR